MTSHTLTSWPDLTLPHWPPWLPPQPPTSHSGWTPEACQYLPQISWAWVLHPQKPGVRYTILHHLVQPPHLSFCGPLVRTSSNVRDWCQVPPPSQVNQNSPCLMTPTTISLSTYSAFSLDRHVMPSPCEQTSSTSCLGQPPPSPWCERQQCSWSWARRTPRSLPPSLVTLFTSALHWETVCFIITSIELESIGRFALEKSLEENLPNHFEIWNI